MVTSVSSACRAGWLTGSGPGALAYASKGAHRAVQLL